MGQRLKPMNTCFSKTMAHVQLALLNKSEPMMEATNVPLRRAIKTRDLREARKMALEMVMRDSQGKQNEPLRECLHALHSPENEARYGGRKQTAVCIGMVLATQAMKTRFRFSSLSFREASTIKIGFEKKVMSF